MLICTKYKHHGITQPLYRSGRRRVLSPRDERTLVRKVQINPRTAAKDLVKMLEEKARLRFATAHGDKYRTFWRNVLWSDEEWAKIHPTYCGKLVEDYLKCLTQVKQFKGNVTKNELGVCKLLTH
ncbi:unnamed protein product [Oncorhynchus mykiss]|uniref:Uncharacterized protein n=1 Tax=Oncorhynchus mykiss TaxID=8022 RepID=A0A060WGU7_ONCMY|nr:unnamed protein product [Oncorhynchus mykiss]